MQQRRREIASRTYIGRQKTCPSHRRPSSKLRYQCFVMSEMKEKYMPFDRSNFGRASYFRNRELADRTDFRSCLRSCSRASEYYFIPQISLKEGLVLLQSGDGDIWSSCLNEAEMSAWRFQQVEHAGMAPCSWGWQCRLRSRVCGAHRLLHGCSLPKLKIHIMNILHLSHKWYTI